MSGTTTGIFDFDNHYYEAEDAFTRHPGETFGEHVWVTPFWEDDIPGLLDVVRTDRLLLGSDWPHAEGTREPVEFVTGTLAGVPAGAVQQISQDNAVALLGITLD